MKVFIFALTLFSITACGPQNPNVDPTTVKWARANQIVIALISLQRAAIDFEKEGILSNSQTRMVVQNTTSAMRAMGPNPVEFQAVLVHSLNEIEVRLDAAGRDNLLPYIKLVQLVAGLIPAMTGGSNGGSYRADIERRYPIGVTSSCSVADSNGSYRLADCRRIARGVRAQPSNGHQGRRRLAA